MCVAKTIRTGVSCVSQRGRRRRRRVHHIGLAQLFVYISRIIRATHASSRPFHIRCPAEQWHKLRDSSCVFFLLLGELFKKVEVASRPVLSFSVFVHNQDSLYTSCFCDQGLDSTGLEGYRQTKRILSIKNGP